MNKYATIMGAILLLVGILGFFEGFAPGGELLGIFAVNAAHNWILIITGLIGLVAGMSHDWSKGLRYAWFLFIAYGLITLLGFIQVPNEGMLFNIVHVNRADHLLHLAITLSALVAIIVAQRRHHYPA